MKEFLKNNNTIVMNLRNTDNLQTSSQKQTNNYGYYVIIKLYFSKMVNKLYSLKDGSFISNFIFS